MTTTWIQNIQKRKYPKLEKNLSSDVVIVGAGMAGSISAYLLAKAGKQVVLIDKSGIEDSVTAYTTAWITTDLDTDWSDLMEMYGDKKAKALFDSGMSAIDAYEQIIKEEKIECEFVRTSVFEYATDGKEAQSLEEEYDSIKENGFAIKLKKESLPGFKNVASLHTPHQAKFHPLKFLNGIQDAAVKYGAQIFHDTEACDIDGNAPVIVTTKDGHKISTEYGIMTTYQPFKNPHELFAKKGMYRSYVFEVSLPKGVIKEGMYLDTYNPYHYFRIDPMEDYDRMILGGEDVREEVPFPEEKSFRALEDFLKDLLPNVEYKIDKKWSGPILENVDGLPYIGMFSKDCDHQLVATAFSGTGMHFSLISAQIFRDIILKKENSDIELYDASREVRIYNFLKKAWDFADEFVGGVIKNLLK